MATSIAFALVPDQRLWYNGIEFPANTHTDSFRISPVKSADGRTFSHHDFTLTVTSYWDTSTPTLARTLSNVLSSLTQPAAGLIYTGRGFGDYSVNIKRTKDVTYGPWPVALEVDPQGGGNSTKLVWSISWSSLTCGDAVYEGLFAHELAFDVTYNIDRFGRTTRIVSGFVSVPATRRNADNRQIPISADELRERIVPQLMPGFRRTSAGEFSLDYSKTKLTFKFEDVRFAGAIPPVGVVDASAKHTLVQDGGKPYSWTGTLSASYALAPGQTIQSALDAYFATLEFRADKIRAGVNLGIFGSFKPKFIPWTVQLTETDLYGTQVVEISTTYKVVGANLRMMLTNGGLWTPVPQQHNNWRRWAASMSGALSARGLDGLVFNTNDDKIVDLCKPDKFVVDLRGGAPPGAGLLGGPGGAADKPINNAALKNAIKAAFPAPESSESWLSYECGVQIEDDHGIIVGSVLPETPLNAVPDRGSFNVQNGQLPTTARENTPFPPANIGSQSSRGGTFVQQRVSPTLYVTIFGRASRHGFPIPVPSLETVGGRPAIPCNRIDCGEGFRAAVVGGDSAGYPIYAAMWRLRYVVADIDGIPRGALVVPPNPLISSAG